MAVPKYYRKSATRLTTLQQRQAKTKKGSQRRAKLNLRIARIHQKVANQRRDFHHKVALKLLAKHQVIAHEDLNIKNLSARCKPKQDENGNFLANGQSRKSGLNKSILDASWASFLDILTFKAEKAGLLVIGVNPSGTSQNCSSCGQKVTKNLKDRWHSCPYCGLEIDRDYNSAIEIKKRAVGHFVLAEKSNARRGKPKREAPTIMATAV